MRNLQNLDLSSMVSHLSRATDFPQCVIDGSAALKGDPEAMALALEALKLSEEAFSAIRRMDVCLAALRGLERRPQ